MQKIRVLVADDSGLMRLIISDIVNKHPLMEVVDTARNGKEAVEKALALNPHVILLDMNMGEFDGLYTIKNLLESKYIPIVILSAIGNSNLEPIYEGLRLGAFDYLNKPDKNNSKVREIEKEILDKVLLAAEHGQKDSKIDIDFSVNQNSHTFHEVNYDIIAVGSSTGGPSAVEQFITKLPKNLPIPVVIAQHMPANFVKAFVKRLDALTPLKVKEGIEGDFVKPGEIVIAPGDHNMILFRKGNQIMVDYTTEKFKEFNNPSVNALFLSVARVFKNKAIGIILTGMGKDGADGTEAIFNAGGFTVAQNKETCAVFGMPREVVERKVVHGVVPIHEMAGYVISCLS